MESIVAYCALNTNWREVLKCVTLGAISFGVTLGYLTASTFTGIWVALGCSSVVSIVFTVGFNYSYHFRCAVAVFFVQIFSHLGLLMALISASWVTVEDSLAEILKTQSDLHSPQCLNSNKINDMLDDSIEYIGTVISILHYTNLVPWLCIFVYSFLYECTYDTDGQRREQMFQNVPQERENFCLKIAKYVMFFVGGLMVGSTVMCFLVKKITISTLINPMPDGDCKNLLSTHSGYLWMVIYLVFTAILIVLLPFSKKILKIRGHIITKCFSNETGNRQTTNNFYIQQPRSRIPMECIVRSRIESQRADHYPSQSQPQRAVNRPKALAPPPPTNNTQFNGFRLFKRNGESSDTD